MLGSFKMPKNQTECVRADYNASLITKMKNSISDLIHTHILSLSLSPFLPPSLSCSHTHSLSYTHPITHTYTSSVYILHTNFLLHKQSCKKNGNWMDKKRYKNIVTLLYKKKICFNNDKGPRTTLCEKDVSHYSSR